ncbi:TPA: acyltransferase [bacterium]|nr:MAG: acyltransferase [Candidatus Hydrogenedentes bacterium CG1_02_42_14]PIU48612.1 MAG: acyltransferase [Candidatus Hydrogenedentes bacterium CG07_land_8_20_14_0_80_42_17]HBW46441.1 acyltransferase [bacterium]
MKRIVRGGLVQAKNVVPAEESVQKIKKGMLELHDKFVDTAGKKGVQVLCFQEIFFGPYFCPEQVIKWLDSAEALPDEKTPLKNISAKKYPTLSRYAAQAKKKGIIIILPIFEMTFTGVYYNTCAFIDYDGTFLGKFRKIQIPHTGPGFWEKYYFKPGNLGYPVFETGAGKLAAYICYDRHFPEGWRILGLHGAEIVFNPSATVAGLSEYLWRLEQPAAAVANIYYIGAINRVGYEKPWSIGEFYGQSYFCNPRGQFTGEAFDVKGKKLSDAPAPRDKDALVVADLDLETILEVRKVWQFYRDRRPETYGDLPKLLP